jgi:hypothetical protein
MIDPGGKRVGNLSSTFEKADSTFTVFAQPPVHRKNKQLTLLSQCKTCIYRKKYIDNCKNLKGHNQA